MKKQTISKIAAIAIAAMSVVPMFGVTASADLTFDAGTDGNGSFKQAYGTPYVAHWQITWVKHTDYTVEAYDAYKVTPKSGGADVVVKKYRLKEAATSDTITYMVNDTSDKTVPTPSGDQTLAPCGYVYYAYSYKLPDDYSNGAKSGVKDVLDKAKKDAADDKIKVAKALNALNQEADDFYSALQAWNNNGNTIKQIRKADGTTVNVNAPSGINGAFTTYANSNGTGATGTYTVSDTYTFQTADDKLVYNTTASLTNDTAVIYYDYLYDTSTKAISAADVIGNLHTDYVVLDTDGTTLVASVKGTGYKIINGGEVVPNQNPDGSSSSGVADPDGKDKDDTTTPTDTTTIPSNPVYAASYPWYSALTNRYYKTEADATAASGGKKVYVSYGNAGTTTTTTSYDSNSYCSSTYPYYSSLTGRYYRTWETAVAASGNNSSYVKYAYTTSVSSSSTYSSTYPWYSSYTGRYYKTYADAVSVSPSSSYVSNGNYYNPYYYYGLPTLSGLGTTSTTSTSSKNTSSSSTVSVGGSSGWSAVTKALSNAKSGSEVTVNMGSETTIPADVMSALQGKNVTVDFKLGNGATYAINGTTVSSTGSVNVATTYGAKNIPSSIVSKAVKANDGVSSAQFSVSNGSLGANAAVTVKVSDKRAGSSAKLYRYDSSSNSLTLVSKSAVQSTGKVEFTNVKQGGNYVIVLS